MQVFSDDITDIKEVLNEYIDFQSRGPYKILWWVHLFWYHLMNNQCRASTDVAFPSLEEIWVVFDIQEIW